MTLFWTLAGVGMAIAVALLAPALLRQQQQKQDDDQRRASNVRIARERLAELEAEHARGDLDNDTFEQASRELKLSLADDLQQSEQATSGTGSTALLVTLALAVPAASIGLYLQFGSPEHLDVAGPGPDPRSAAVAHAKASNGGKLPSIEEMVVVLREKLEEKPDNPEGWALLGQTYAKMGRFEDAAYAWRKLREQVGDNPDVLIRLADAVAMVNGGSMLGEPAELIRKAVEMKPDDPTANWLAGNAADEEGNLVEAIGHWSKVRGMLADNPEYQAELSGLIAEARAKLGDDAPPEEVVAAAEQSQAAPAEPADSDAPSIQVAVSLSPELADQVKPGDRLFIFAKAEQGPPMPLAAARLTASQLPASVTLDDSSAMLPQMKLSMFPRVLVGARIAKSGGPVAKSGDLTAEAVAMEVKPGQSVELVIDQVVP